MHHGMLTIYKEAGYTSSDAVARLRGILRMRKIGHTGTLDPDAQGVLPMCLGNATRICELIADREKEYVAVMRLGIKTDTQDMSGNVLFRMEDDEMLSRLSTEERIRSAAASFVGEIDQVPPMYSAVKINGKRLYDMARKGITVERKPRRITIYSIRVEKIEPPLVTMRICCSKGTYIRTLCEDIGEALGTGAAMQSLLRTRVGQFFLGEARTLDEVERIAKTSPEELPLLIRPVDSFFENLPAGICAADALRLLKNGNPLTTEDLSFPGPSSDPLVQTGASRESQDRTGAGQTENGFSTAERSASGEIPPRAPLPGLNPADKVIRVYDDRGVFYGLYVRKQRQNRFTAYKMFLPEG